MNILLVPDKFKGSLTAGGVIEALKSGINRVLPDASTYAVIASDGGDGFLEAVAQYISVEEVQVDTPGPLGRNLRATYLFDPENLRAYIELARASGIVLLADSEKNPFQTSTLGTGNQIMDAISRGAKAIYIGLGGSATNDGGIGIAQALGFHFFDIMGNHLEPIGGNLDKIDRITAPEISELLRDVTIYAVNDVSNPLYGENGAAHIYARQKGANGNEIELLDAGLRNLNKVAEQQFKVFNAQIPGAGAAGGTAYGLKTFAGAHFISGIDFILELASVEELLQKKEINYIITGEGRIDEQTLNGKLINGVLNLGKRYQIPVMAVCGSLDMDKAELKKHGIHEVLEVRDPSRSLEYNMENAAELVEKSIFEFLKKSQRT
ncbi:MAG TPA: glycerate kinase [Eudoraea sp.]|nr:glycerate kinase [Eudoraea sp.]